jgi:hypothetical protein
MKQFAPNRYFTDIEEINFKLQNFIQEMEIIYSELESI